MNDNTTTGIRAGDQHRTDNTARRTAFSRFRESKYNGDGNGVVGNKQDDGQRYASNRASDGESAGDSSRRTNESSESAQRTIGQSERNAGRSDIANDTSNRTTGGAGKSFERIGDADGDGMGRRGRDPESTGDGRPIVERITGESDGDYKRRRDRINAKWRRDEKKRQQSIDTQNDFSRGSSTTVNNENDDEDDDNNGDIIVDTPLTIEVDNRESPKMDNKSTPKTATPTKKKRVATKTEVDDLASTIQDFYAVADGLIGMFMSYKGLPYVNGLFSLDDDIARDIAKPLIDINDMLPKLAKRAKKASAPARLATAVSKDLVRKGVILNAIIKNPELANQINTDKNSG